MIFGYLSNSKNKIKFIPKHKNILLFGYELKVPSNELTLCVKIELVKLALVNLDLAMKLQTQISPL
jgi:hypothetical protein